MRGKRNNTKEQNEKGCRAREGKTMTEVFWLTFANEFLYPPIQVRQLYWSAVGACKPRQTKIYFN